MILLCLTPNHAPEPFEIPWYVWAGLCLYLAVRHQGSGYTKGSLCKAAADGNIALVRKLLAVNHGQYALELDHKVSDPRADERNCLLIPPMNSSCSLPLARLPLPSLGLFPSHARGPSR